MPATQKEWPPYSARGSGSIWGALLKRRGDLPHFALPPLSSPENASRARSRRPHRSPEQELSGEKARVVRSDCRFMVRLVSRRSSQFARRIQVTRPQNGRPKWSGRQVREVRRGDSPTSIASSLFACCRGPGKTAYQVNAVVPRAFRTLSRKAGES